MLPALAGALLLLAPAAAADPVRVVVDNPVCDLLVTSDPPCYDAEVRVDPDAVARCLAELDAVPPCLVVACPLMWPPQCGNEAYFVGLT